MSASTKTGLCYVLITPARNEERFIGATINAVISQKTRPMRWVIVSDGSTDGTDAIVLEAARQHSWIRLLRLPEHRDRQFAAKANAFNAGHAALADLPFEVVGNLDADITFDADYFEYLLGQFQSNSRLGVAGTPFVEDAAHPDRHTYAHPAANIQHVSGACQMFRRACFDAVGGYVPIKGGAIDWIAVTTARMKGWETRTFTGKVCLHHRAIGTAGSGPVRARFHYGRKAYYVGGHPAWEIPRAFAQLGRAPYVVGGLAFLAGYLWAASVREPRPVSQDLISFHQGEQLQRLRNALRLGGAARGTP